MYDPYYETKVMPSWGRTMAGCILGILLIIIGVMMAVFTIADLSAGTTPELGSAWQENSIWPTIGKGIWVGLFLIGTGIIGIISKRERTIFSMFVFNALAWASTILSLFVILCCILHIQPYATQGFNSIDLRSKTQNVEVAMNSLLIFAGSFGVFIGLLSALLSCQMGNCCQNRRHTVLEYPYPYPTHDYSVRPWSGPFTYTGPYGTE